MVVVMCNVFLVVMSVVSLVMLMRVSSTAVSKPQARLHPKGLQTLVSVSHFREAPGQKVRRVGQDWDQEPRGRPSMLHGRTLTVT